MFMLKDRHQDNDKGLLALAYLWYGFLEILEFLYDLDLPCVRA
jgi:hypothetical protein